MADTSHPIKGINQDNGLWVQTVLCSSLLLQDWNMLLHFSGSLFSYLQMGYQCSPPKDYDEAGLRKNVYKILKPDPSPTGQSVPTHSQKGPSSPWIVLQGLGGACRVKTKFCLSNWVCPRKQKLFLSIENGKRMFSISSSLKRSQSRDPGLVKGNKEEGGAYLHKAGLQGLL